VQQSNFYIVAYTVVFCSILATALATVAEALKSKQDEQVELDTRKQILGAVMSVKGVPKEELSKIYDKRIQAIVVNSKGEVLPDDPKKVNVLVEYKSGNKDDMRLPVYKFLSENDPNKVEAIIVPMYGRGLWDLIWGYMALDEDLNTIKGIVFDHKGETPGLGARISTEEVQKRYKEGKKLFDNSFQLVGVQMLKGEGKDRTLSAHEVDGMSGATITGNGVNEMLLNYAGLYNAYFSEERRAKQQPKQEPTVSDSTMDVSFVPFK
jgi:Na+-transporting NADH:ubiquinone oxidoreductase subunit C